MLALTEKASASESALADSMRLPIRLTGLFGTPLRDSLH
jgi:hypothetical protein